MRTEQRGQDLSGSVRRLGRWFVTFFAVQVSAEILFAPNGREYPRAIREGRLVPDVLSMTTGEIGDPIAVFILVISDDGLLHVEVR